MKTKNDQAEELWESDAVWKLLDSAPAPKASPRFADNTLRALRNSTPKFSWWKSLLTPAPLISLSTTAAVAALAIAFFPNSETTPIHDDFELSTASDEITEINTLIASIDHIDELSDSELIALIGY